MSETVAPAEDHAVSDPIIELQGVDVTFNMDRGTSKVLDDVSIGIERGETLGVVGESGSGKSMFASSMLNAIVDPGVVSGSVMYYPEPDRSVDVLSLKDRDLRRARWEEISMVFQGAMSSWNPTMRIREHFIETLKAHNADTESGMQRAHELLADLYLDPERVLSAYPHELSGGMQQRALIALSMVLEPEVLVMDEPTAALDLLMQRSILILLEDLKEKYDITLVFITHDLPLVAELSDRLAVMYAFEFIEVAPTEEMLGGALHPYSRALLNSTPNLGTDLDEMHSIEGSSPDPVEHLEGCSYHPRCPLADETCTSEDPALETKGPDHQVSCFHWQDSEDAIPVTFESESVNEDAGDVVSADRRNREEEEAVVSVEDLEVHFETNTGLLNLFSEADTVKAVDGVSLDIPEKEVIALVGESGCGKTTLGKTAIGLEKPTGGSVKYRDQDIWETKSGNADGPISFEQIRKSLQIIHQDPGSSLNPNHKVMKILAKPLKKWAPDLSKLDRRARILGMLEKVGMTPPDDYARRYPHQLSGGEKQRIALIRALLMQPDLILADEAISALDVSLRIEMMDLFLDLMDEFDTSFLFISHDLSNARYLTEKANGLIGIMYLGKLVEIGPAKEVLADPRHPYTQVLKWATPELKGTDSSDLPMRKIDIPDPTDPPSGCRFHTRCPEAREVCREESPEQITVSQSRHVACFRECDQDHEYWDSEPVVSDD